MVGGGGKKEGRDTYFVGASELGFGTDVDAWN